jgi:phage-related protein
MAQRDLVFMGRSQRDLAAFPEAVQDVVALALLDAVDGLKHQDAMPMKGFGGASVLELRQSFATDEYRVVYTTRFPEAICVLHAFKKKSRKGVETPKRDVDLIRQRLKTAIDLHAKGVLP